jgi:hypothetical protein
MEPPCTTVEASLTSLVEEAALAFAVLSSPLLLPAPQAARRELIRAGIRNRLSLVCIVCLVGIDERNHKKDCGIGVRKRTFAELNIAELVFF